MGTIRLYADNACDLDKELLESLGVKLFYISVSIRGNVYFDRLNLEPKAFYQMLAADSTLIPTTAQIGPAVFQEEFARVIDETDDEIIYLAFSSGLSGTYNSACIARDLVSPERITVVDTLSASVGYGLTVIRAAQAIKAGKSKEEVLAEVTDNINRMEHLFIVGNFDMLKRGGRVNAAAATLGDLLNIKLILHFRGGKIYPLEKVHGLKKAKKRLLELIAERSSNLSNQLIGINYSYDNKGALELQSLMREKFGCSQFVISEIGAVIGSHVGAGTYSVFFLRD
ncbi:MAG: DegV family protein [Syntrophomonadaceae bacterium]|jgi:DegV family protein with EDD domain